MAPRKALGGAVHHTDALRTYETFLADVVGLLENARHASARAVNPIITATYWAVGRRIVEHEQGGHARAKYGDELVARLSMDLTARFGRGFGVVNLSQMKRFYLGWPSRQILQTLSEKSLPPIRSTTSEESRITSPAWNLSGISIALPLPWSHYIRLLSVRNPAARRFYEAEALRGGWTVRQLTRQIDSQFYERTVLSRNKAKALERGRTRRPEDALTADEELKDPPVLEFLGLRDENSESNLEDALIRHLERFLDGIGERLRVRRAPETATD